MAVKSCEFFWQGFLGEGAVMLSGDGKRSTFANAANADWLMHSNPSSDVGRSHHGSHLCVQMLSVHVEWNFPFAM